jgi:hypothetical protein
MNKKAVVGVIALLMIGLLVASIPPAKAQFVLASWSYPDEYGQGLYQIEVDENSTGAWVEYGEGGYYEAGDSLLFPWNVSVGIRLVVYTRLNSTLTGIPDKDNWGPYQRLNVTVTQNNGTVVFSQQNITTFYTSSSFGEIYRYGFMFVLEFLPNYGEIYAATVTYEVFY